MFSPLAKRKSLITKSPARWSGGEARGGAFTIFTPCPRAGSATIAAPRTVAVSVIAGVIRARTIIAVGVSIIAVAVERGTVRPVIAIMLRLLELDFGAFPALELRVKD